MPSSIEMSTSNKKPDIIIHQDSLFQCLVPIYASYFRAGNTKQSSFFECLYLHMNSKQFECNDSVTQKFAFLVFLLSFQSCPRPPLWPKANSSLYSWPRPMSFLFFVLGLRPQLFAFDTSFSALPFKDHFELCGDAEIRVQVILSPVQLGSAHTTGFVTSVLTQLCIRLPFKNSSWGMRSLPREELFLPFFYKSFFVFIYLFFNSCIQSQWSRAHDDNISKVPCFLYVYSEQRHRYLAPGDVG